MSPDRAEFKRLAAWQAVEAVESGMVLGLGAGSTALLAIQRLGQLIAQGRLDNILGVPCSEQVAAQARAAGISLTSLEERPSLDLTIDGADEVDPQLNLIKGGGGALLREKIVAQASRREIIVVDESKLSPKLGTRWPLPVEVVPFGWPGQAAFLESLGARVKLRRGDRDQPFVTDGGNYILDAHFGPLADPAGLAARLQERAGLVEHGLFLGLADEVIVAGRDGLSRLKGPA